MTTYREEGIEVTIFLWRRVLYNKIKLRRELHKFKAIRKKAGVAQIKIVSVKIN